MKIALLLILLLYSTSAISQHKDIDPNMIQFEINSYKLTKQSMAKLDTILPIIKKRIAANCIVRLVNWSCPNETQKNNFIGVMRSKVIAQYYELTYKLPLDKFLIEDQNLDSTDWKIPCQMKNVKGYIYIQGGFCYPE